jgi:hypothetical protein
VLGLDTGMPSIKVVPGEDSSRQGYEAVQQAFGPGAPGALQVIADRSEAHAVEATLGRDPGIALVDSDEGRERQEPRGSCLPRRRLWALHQVAQTPASTPTAGPSAARA